MKNLFLLFLVFIPILCQAQIEEAKIDVFTGDTIVRSKTVALVRVRSHNLFVEVQALNKAYYLSCKFEQSYRSYTQTEGESKLYFAFEDGTVESVTLRSVEDSGRRNFGRTFYTMALYAVEPDVLACLASKRVVKLKLNTNERDIEYPISFSRGRNLSKQAAAILNFSYELKKLKKL